MKLECFLALFLAFCCTQATILVKFGYVVSHYKKHMKNGYPGQDPLENFNLHSRQILCDAIINAKQFKLKFNPSYYAKRPQEYLRTRWTNWDSLDRITKNIQRSSRKKFLEYQLRNVRLGSRDYRQIKCLPCVITRKVEWFITFGFVDKFLYVLEKRNEKSPNSHGLRLTAILEPSAVINNQPLEYLYNQLQTSKELMESICDLGSDDRVRVCGALFDALNTEGSLPYEIKQMNDVKRWSNICPAGAVKFHLYGESVGIRALRCSIVDEALPLLTIHALADSLERGAVFVFFDDVTELDLHARVTKIGALLNPSGQKQVRLQMDRVISYNKYLKSKPKSKQKKRKRKMSDSEDSSKEYTDLGVSEDSTEEEYKEHARTKQKRKMSDADDSSQEDTDLMVLEDSTEEEYEEHARKKRKMSDSEDSSKETNLVVSEDSIKEEYKEHVIEKRRTSGRKVGSRKVVSTQDSTKEEKNSEDPLDSDYSPEEEHRERRKINRKHRKIVDVKDPTTIEDKKSQREPKISGQIEGRRMKRKVIDSENLTEKNIFKNLMSEDEYLDDSNDSNEEEYTELSKEMSEQVKTKHLGKMVTDSEDLKNHSGKEYSKDLINIDDSTDEECKKSWEEVSGQCKWKRLKKKDSDESINIDLEDSVDEEDESYQREVSRNKRGRWGTNVVDSESSNSGDMDSKNAGQVTWDDVVMPESKWSSKQIRGKRKPRSFT